MLFIQPVLKWYSNGAEEAKLKLSGPNPSGYTIGMRIDKSKTKMV